MKGLPARFVRDVVLSVPCPETAACWQDFTGCTRECPSRTRLCRVNCCVSSYGTPTPRSVQHFSGPLCFVFLLKYGSSAPSMRYALIKLQRHRLLVSALRTFSDGCRVSSLVVQLQTDDCIWRPDLLNATVEDLPLERSDRYVASEVSAHFKKQLSLLTLCAMALVLSAAVMGIRLSWMSRNSMTRVSRQRGKKKKQLR